MEIGNRRYQTFREGIQACVPTMLGYLGIGFAAGVVEKGVGMSLLEILLVSMLVYYLWFACHRCTNFLDYFYGFLGKLAPFFDEFIGNPLFSWQLVAE